MEGTYVNIYGLTFDAALKIVSAFDDYLILNKKKSFFNDGEVALALSEGNYRVTAIDDLLHIERIERVINSDGKHDWRITGKVSINRDSYNEIIIR